jgi:arginyl-tRNA synthetase
VFPDGSTGRDGTPLPLIVRRSNGGFGCQATDLAAIRYRIRGIGAQRRLYVIGSPQRQHLEMVFETCSRWRRGP